MAPSTREPEGNSSSPRVFQYLMMDRRRVSSPLVAVSFVPAFACMLAAVLFSPPHSEARPVSCFGKKTSRVVTGSARTVRLKRREVAWVAGDRVTVFAGPYAVVCSGGGRQIVRGGRGRSRISTGGGDDRIILHPSSSRNVVRAGLGNDRIKGSTGNDFLWASPKLNLAGRPDRDVVDGHGGNDRIYDHSGIGNRIHGGNGSDHIHSLGNAISEVYGGNGSDFLHATGGRRGGRIDSLFGERGNDRLRGDTRPVAGPAFLDGGVGDDWIYGSDHGDVIIFRSGITKIRARAGNDLIVSGSRGRATIDGGPGRDTASYAAHTPPDGGGRGVTVDLENGFARGIYRRAPQHRLTSIENAEGSPFDDVLTGRPGIDNTLEGGLGDDVLRGNPQDRDGADGGPGLNECSGFTAIGNCNAGSPGRPDGRKPVVDMSRGGVLTVLGSSSGDRITVGYRHSGGGRYRVELDRPAATSGRCGKGSGTAVSCDAPGTNLNGVVLHGGDGDDRLEVAGSVPANVTTAINGGTGSNRLIGGRTKDYIETAEARSAGSMLKGRGNSDVIYSLDRVTVAGGAGPDVLHVRDVCRGGRVAGGNGKDNLVFAGASGGVDADLARGSARWSGAPCEEPLRMGHDIESLEGSRHDDRLTIGRRFRAQQGDRSLLGREGIDILNSRNGTRDTVTTASGGRRNRVIADPFDRVVWGWGLAGY